MRSAGGIEAHERQVELDAGVAVLAADLTLPWNAAGVVVFAHGSGSGRKSPRNRAVAAALVDAGFGTLLLDLLTADEEREDARTGRWRFDIGLLAERLAAAVDWVGQQNGLRALPIGCFGASTGAAAALIVAARRADSVGAVVSRGGRPDLAGSALADVTAPTLLIVGGADTQVIELNREAAGRMGRAPRLEIVPGATHLFEEPGKLEQVAALACDWFGSHLTEHQGQS
jgi:dienelactone hydrolase